VERGHKGRPGPFDPERRAGVVRHAQRIVPGPSARDGSEPVGQALGDLRPTPGPGPGRLRTG
jgi:hypothetical protein